MSSDSSSDPDRTGLILYVGQDRVGHWLVQDNHRSLEGRFISYSAALHYAQAEQGLYHARVEIASAPLIPLISFAPLRSDERALPRAA